MQTRTCPVDPGSGGSGASSDAMTEPDPSRSESAGAPAAPCSVPTLGCPCAEAGDLGCNGPAQKLQLRCEAGNWAANGTCGSSENCDGENGACAPIVDGCDAVGAPICLDGDVHACGADLVTTSLVERCARPCEQAPDGALCVGTIGVATGATHTCALLSTGQLRCWGFGGDGQLGYDSATRVSDGAGPSIGEIGDIDLGEGVRAVRVVAGGAHSCALTSTGTVRCWGDGSQGQLGYGNNANVGDGRGPSIAQAGDLDFGDIEVVDLAAGASHTCAILSTGAVRCWGLGGDGQLGYGTGNSVADGIGPSLTEAGDIDFGVSSPVIQLALGTSHSCALFETGAVRCWGLGSSGQLGYGATASVGDGIGLSVAEVGDLDFGAPLVVEQIAAGAFHTCAKFTTGGMRCWGLAEDGQLGYGTTTSVGDGIGPALASVGNIALGTTVARIAAGAFHTCALTSLGDVTCWGQGNLGQLGYGTTLSIGNGSGPGVGDLGPVEFGAGIVADEIAAGAFHSCASFAPGRLRCWGFGGDGQLGQDSTTSVGDDELPADVGFIELY